MFTMPLLFLFPAFEEGIYGAILQTVQAVLSTWCTFRIVMSFEVLPARKA